MELSSAAIGVLLIVSIVLALVALGAAAAALTDQRRTRRAYEVFSRGSTDDVLTLLARHIDEVGALRDDVERIGWRADELRELVGAGVSRVGTVRYNAFEDMGGQLSFSVALLDERGNGILLTSINGRAETRTYAKTVTAGESRQPTSDEEQEAIAAALGHGGGARARGMRSRRYGRADIAARDAS